MRAGEVPDKGERYRSFRVAYGLSALLPSQMQANRLPLCDELSGHIIRIPNVCTHQKNTSWEHIGVCVCRENRYMQTKLMDICPFFHMLTFGVNLLFWFSLGIKSFQKYET